jgi:chitin-binding protein
MNRFYQCLSLLALLSFSSMPAFSHGTMLEPISRVYSCYLQLTQGQTLSPACQAAVNKSGVQMLYDWNGINQLPNSNHQAFVPSGELCSGGKQLYRGLDEARLDWEATIVTPDRNGDVEFTYYASAPHATRYFKFYITKDSYDHTSPLKWSDLEPAPFCEVQNIEVQNHRYKMTCRLPSSKTGRHIIYNIWQRSDSPEAFYACSDVVIRPRSDAQCSSAGVP